jgi:hypothetical protein
MKGNENSRHTLSDDSILDRKLSDNEGENEQKQNRTGLK